MGHCFPFGQPLKDVVQQNRTPKRVFVLGVYASAVHARWVAPDGKTLVRALAVASEPCIFWRGENAAEIIAGIQVPPELGKLEASKLNGPSGNTLDGSILKPLGLTRDDAWLCDLVPHSCCNPAQLAAIKRGEYNRKAQPHGLPAASIPPKPKVLADDARQQAILSELIESQAEILILLGDEPIKWCLRPLCPQWQWKRLSAIQSYGSYGQLHDAQIGQRKISVLPLVHPRQIERLGSSSKLWSDRHKEWECNPVRLP
jgi:uracil-DNA glycosylase